MNLKRFTGRTPRDALALVRQAFGDGAVVMSTKPCAEGVEVLAMAPESVEHLERVGARLPAPTSTSTSARAEPRPSTFGALGMEAARPQPPARVLEVVPHVAPADPHLRRSRRCWIVDGGKVRHVARHRPLLHHPFAAPAIEEAQVGVPGHGKRPESVAAVLNGIPVQHDG